MTRHSRQHADGQAMVEFALLAPTLCLMIMGMIDAGDYLQTRATLVGAVRSGDRFASGNPTSVSNAATPPANTIQGAIANSAGSLTIPNNASHIAISYYAYNPDLSPYSEALCATYSYSSNAVVYQPGYSYDSCMVVGSIVRLTITYTWVPKTPVISSVINFAPSITTTYELLIA